MKYGGVGDRNRGRKLGKQTVTPNGSISAKLYLQASLALREYLLLSASFAIAFLFVSYQTSLLIQEATLKIVCYFTLPFLVSILQQAFWQAK